MDKIVGINNSLVSSSVRITLTTEIHLGEVEVGVHSGFRFKKPGTEQICSFGRILLLLCKEKRQGERMYRIVKFGQFWPVIIINLWIQDRKSTRLNSSHVAISYAVFC